MYPSIDCQLYLLTVGYNGDTNNTSQHSRDDRKKRANVQKCKNFRSKLFSNFFKNNFEILTVGRYALSIASQEVLKNKEEKKIDAAAIAASNMPASTDTSSGDFNPAMLLSMMLQRQNQNPKEQQTLPAMTALPGQGIVAAGAVGNIDLMQTKALLMADMAHLMDIKLAPLYHRLDSLTNRVEELVALKLNIERKVQEASRNTCSQQFGAGLLSTPSSCFSPLSQSVMSTGPMNGSGVAHNAGIGALLCPAGATVGLLCFDASLTPQNMFQTAEHKEFDSRNSGSTVLRPYNLPKGKVQGANGCDTTQGQGRLTRQVRADHITLFRDKIPCLRENNCEKQFPRSYIYMRIAIFYHH